MSNKYQKYKPGLDYLKNSGLDLVVEQDFIIKSVFTFKEHSYFGETKKDCAVNAFITVWWGCNLCS